MIFKLQVMAALLALSLALSGASYFAGIHHERTAQHTRELIAKVKAFREAEMVSRKLYEKETELKNAQTELEDAINAIPDSSKPGLSVDGVRALNRIVGHSGSGKN